MKIAVIANSHREGMTLAFPLLASAWATGSTSSADLYLPGEWTERRGADYDCILQRVIRRDPFLVIPVNGGMRRIPWDQLLYVLSDDHYAQLVLREEKLRTRLPFAKICESLEDGPFLVCNRGILLNMDCIASFDRRSFSMQDGTVFDIRKRNRPAIRARYEKYLQEISEDISCRYPQVP